MTILHSSKEQKQKPGRPPSVVLNLVTPELQSLKSDTGTRLVFSNCFVVFTVNFPENLTGANFFCRLVCETEGKSQQRKVLPVLELIKLRSLQRRSCGSFENFQLQSQYEAKIIPFFSPDAWRCAFLMGGKWLSKFSLPEKQRSVLDDFHFITLNTSLLQRKSYIILNCTFLPPTFIWKGKAVKTIKSCCLFELKHKWAYKIFAHN